MKSYFLEGVVSIERAQEELRRLLPGQEHPWLLLDAAGDVVAYFHTEERDESGFQEAAVEVDISGRHYYSDADVLAILRALQEKVGGRISDDR